VRARLLGLRLLTLDATVLIAPAELAAAPARSGDKRPVVVVDAARRTDGRRPVGGDLTDAARCIDESAASLAAARSRSV
jgi:hypothetical protein